MKIEKVTLKKIFSDFKYLKEERSAETIEVHRIVTKSKVTEEEIEFFEGIEEFETEEAREEAIKEDIEEDIKEINLDVKDIDFIKKLKKGDVQAVAEMLEHYFCERGEIDISGMNFSDNIKILNTSNINLEGDIIQGGHKNKGGISQTHHKNIGGIYQYSHSNEGIIHQDKHYNAGAIHQEQQRNKGTIYQFGHKNSGCIV